MIFMFYDSIVSALMLVETGIDFPLSLCFFSLQYSLVLSIFFNNSRLLTAIKQSNDTMAELLNSCS